MPYRHCKVCFLYLLVVFPGHKSYVDDSLVSMLKQLTRVLVYIAPWLYSKAASISLYCVRNIIQSLVIADMWLNLKDTCAGFRFYSCHSLLNDVNFSLSICMHKQQSLGVSLQQTLI